MTKTETYSSLSFTQAIKLAFKKAVKFKGRATRSEYWWFALFQVGVTGVPFALEYVYLDSSNIFLVLSTLISCILFLPSISIDVRRMHDVNLSGGLVFIQLIPVIGWIVFIGFALQRSDPKSNRYGLAPHPIKTELPKL